jgi:hypothetical protein
MSALQTGHKSESWVSSRSSRGATKLVTHYNGQYGSFIAAEPPGPPSPQSTVVR